MINFAQFLFHPVIALPPDYEVYDFSSGYDPQRPLKSPFGIGRYNEKRQGMYDQDLFADGRNIHMGLDIGAPAGTPVHAFFEGEIFLTGHNSQPGDYGYTLITRHLLDHHELFALFGHLSSCSVANNPVGKKIRKGDIIAHIGQRQENGGWNPHLHFQLSHEKPHTCDMPGVVSEANRTRALEIYPDPRLVLGPLYSD